MDIFPSSENAFSHDCKKRIEFEYMRYFQALAHETPMPFEDEFFHTQCVKTETAEISHDPLVSI